MQQRQMRDIHLQRLAVLNLHAAELGMPATFELRYRKGKQGKTFILVYQGHALGSMHSEDCRLYLNSVYCYGMAQQYSNSRGAYRLFVQATNKLWRKGILRYITDLQCRI